MINDELYYTTFSLVHSLARTLSRPSLLSLTHLYSSTQMATMNTFSDDYMHTLQHGVTAARFGAPGNGAFVHSCHTHCEALSGPWFNVKIGNVSMGDAVKAWWRSDGTEPAAKHTYTPCRYHTQSGKPHMCNPTCAV